MGLKIKKLILVQIIILFVFIVIFKTDFFDEKQPFQTIEAFFHLEEGMTLELTSNVDFFGEKITVLKKEKDTYLIKGQYGNTLNFYRLYETDSNGVNIFFEITEDEEMFNEIKKAIKRDDYSFIFSLKANQEFYILKKPFTPGNNWGYGEIAEATADKIIVRFKNNNTFTFERDKGLTKIIYNISEEMREYFGADKFIAKKRNDLDY